MTEYDPLAKRTYRETRIGSDSYERGHCDGNGEGALRERIEILRQLLEIRFGRLTDVVLTYLQFVSTNDRDRILGRLWTARSPDEVFEGLYLSGLQREEVGVMSP